MDSLEAILTIEDGAEDYEACIEAYQDLINSGTVWILQGHYGRTTQRLIEEGYCALPERKSP